MNKQKDLWEALAQENSKYYINSDFGKNITEKQFRQSGAASYKELIAEDPLIKKGATILDFGCGTGRLTEFMPKDFKRVYGVDISKRMIEEACVRLANLENIYLKEIDGRYIPLPEGSVETVFSYLVFQHIKDPEMIKQAYFEIYRILSFGGIFKVLMRSDKPKRMGHWSSGANYTPEEIAQVYEKIGFTPIKIDFIDESAYWLWLQKPVAQEVSKTNWEKGKKITLLHYRRKLYWKNKTHNHPDIYLPDYFGEMIGDKKEVKIAELGSGMFCTIGSLWKTAKVEIYASDMLAASFEEILKEFNIKSFIPVTYEDMENLSYPDNFFDIAHCRNALDHSLNPVREIMEMYRVVKPGGYIYLRHFVNAGESLGYSGLHFWNINLDENGNFIIWNKEKYFNINNYLPGFKSVKKTELDNENDDMVVSKLQKI